MNIGYMEAQMKHTTEHVLNVPVDAAWHLMGERFADIGEWSDTVLKSSLDGPLEAGSVRTCDLKPTPAGLNQIQEKITHFDAARRSMGFDIVSGLPGFVHKLHSSWTLEDAGDGRTRAINTLTIELAWWMRPVGFAIRKQFGKTIALFMREIETVAARAAPRVEGLALAG